MCCCLTKNCNFVTISLSIHGYSVKKNIRPEQTENLSERIRKCIENDRYIQTKHALQRESERSIELSDALYVLRHGRHEKNKTTFDEIF